MATITKQRRREINQVLLDQAAASGAAPPDMRLVPTAERQRDRRARLRTVRKAAGVVAELAGPEIAFENMTDAQKLAFFEVLTAIGLYDYRHGPEADQ